MHIIRQDTRTRIDHQQGDICLCYRHFGLLAHSILQTASFGFFQTGCIYQAKLHAGQMRIALTAIACHAWLVIHNRMTGSR